MKPSESAQIEFIKDCLRKGDKRGKILAKFGKEWQNTPARTFDRRLKAASDALAGELSAIKEKAGVMIEAEAKELKGKIMTELERQVRLSQIANGEIQIPTSEAKWDAHQKKFVKIPVMELPSHSAMISAIAELNKMDGTYSPEKVNITGASVVIRPTRNKKA